jgi:hypothetical protein
MSPRHQRQVVTPDIHGHGGEHQNESDPETPVLMRTFPVRHVAMMALTQRMRVLSIVQSNLLSRRNLKKSATLPKYHGHPHLTMPMP